MSSKRSTGKYEVDLQRFRDEGNWKKIIEIAEQQNGKVGVDGNPQIFYLCLQIFIFIFISVLNRALGHISTWGS